MKMKFRTYVIAALATTALVPLIAWSLLQWSDIRSSLAKDDWEQRFFTGIGSAFLVERMKSVDVFAAHVESETAKRLRAGVTCASLEGFLAELAAANPYIRSLKCTGADTPAARAARSGGTAWRLEPGDDGGSLRFYRRIADRADVVIEGTAERGELFRDIAAMYNMRGVRFVLLDEERRYVWPVLGLSGRAVWDHALGREGLIEEAGERFWMSANRFAHGAPQWTMIALKPQEERIADRREMIGCTLLLAVLVLSLTAAAGFAAIRPLSRSMRRLRGDLDEASYGTPETTLASGPEEFLEFQRAYRALREKLDDRRRRLEADNVRLEETVERRSSELEARERLFAQVFDDIHEGMMLLDEDWRLRYGNHAAGTLIGVDGMARLAEVCRSGLERRSDGTALVTIEAGGRSLVLECDAFPFGAAADGLRSGCCVLFRDVTGRTEVERMKDDLISIVAHELRTPLTACRLQLDLLVKENGPQSAYAAMGEDLDHLGRIVDDWLSVARIDGGSYRVESRIVQTMPLVTRAVRLVRSRHEFRFDYDIAEEAECIRVDPSAFVELLVNLFTNACRHARPGEEPRIEFCARVDEMLVVDVCDSGTGFPEGEAEKLFDRFYQVEQGNKRRTGGTGLGLVICRAICRAHGGRIEALRLEGRTVFRITLPMPSQTDGL